MAKIKARKEYIVLISIIVFIYSLAFVNPQRVRVPQNIKLIDPVNSINSLLKEGEEVYIVKDSNRKFKKTDELVLIQEGIKPKKSIFDEYGKVNSIRLEQVGNNIKAHAEFKEISQELLDWLNNKFDSSNCKIDNTLVPINESSIPTNGCHKWTIPDELMKEIQRIAKEYGGFGNIGPNETQVHVSLSISVAPSIKIEPPELQVCNDTSIFIHIIDSLSEIGTETNITQICDYDLTEKQAKIDFVAYYSRTRLFVIYIWIILPLFIVFYLQNELHNKLDSLNSNQNYSNNRSNNTQKLKKMSQNYWAFENDYYARNTLNNSFSKNTKGKKKPQNAIKDAMNIGSFGKVLQCKLLSINESDPSNIDRNDISSLPKLKDTNDNLSPYVKILIKIYYFLTGKEFPIMQPCDVYSHLDIQDKFTTHCENHAPCKFCNEYNEITCPNHSHLYSTDEASSSEADFIGLSNIKPTKVKAKKAKRDVKRTK